MTESDLDSFIETQNWRFVKTMPQWPHWYCLLADTPDAAKFFAFVRHIREAGYQAEFRPEKREAWAVRWYLDVGPHHYWTMDETLEKTTLINRALHPNAAFRL